MKFCSKCGNAVEENTAFCSMCGARIENNDKLSTAESQENLLKVGSGLQEMAPPPSQNYYQNQQNRPQNPTQNQFSNQYQPQNTYQPQSQYQQQNYNSQPSYYQSTQVKPEESGAFGWGFLGFVIPLVGLILYLIWKDTKPKCSKAAGIGAIIKLAVIFAVIIIPAIIGYISRL
jgi:hypothetical protein